MSREAVLYTGDDPSAYDSPTLFLRYAQRELGVEIPVGRERNYLHRRLKEEMDAHLWTWDDLAKGVRYCKAKRIQPVKVWGILYQVDAAKKWREVEDRYELQAKVADALAVETDPIWIRRLSLASGKALAEVYEDWRNRE